MYASKTVGSGSNNELASQLPQVTLLKAVFCRLSLRSPVKITYGKRKVGSLLLSLSTLFFISLRFHMANHMSHYLFDRF